MYLKVPFIKQVTMIQIATESDLDFVYNLYMHPAINPYLLYEYMDQKSFEPVFDGLLANGHKFIFTSDGQRVGMFKLIPLSWRTSHIVYLGGLAIHPGYAGKGYGKMMLEEILQFSQRRNFLRIELSVAVSNEKAIHLYKSVGFNEEGILTRYTHLKAENKFVDEVMMACLF
jgi:putative acetyltransferase